MTQPSTETATPPTGKDDWMAYVALVLGVASCAMGCFTGIPAMALGALALRRSSGNLRPLAMAGIGLGGLATVVGIVVAALFLGGAILAVQADQGLQDFAEPVQDDQELENWDAE